VYFISYHSSTCNCIKIKWFSRLKYENIFTNPLIASLHSKLKRVCSLWHVAWCVWIACCLLQFTLLHKHLAVLCKASVHWVQRRCKDYFTFFDDVSIVGGLVLWNQFHSIHKYSFSKASRYFVPRYSWNPVKASYRQS
jgi:hypothetical protein